MFDFEKRTTKMKGRDKKNVFAKHKNMKLNLEAGDQHFIERGLYSPKWRKKHFHSERIITFEFSFLVHNFLKNPSHMQFGLSIAIFAWY